MKAAIVERDGKLAVTFPYHPDTVLAVKEIDGRRAWDKEAKSWLFPAEPLVAMRLADLLGIDYGQLPASMRPSEPDAEPIELPDVSDAQWNLKPYRHQVRGLAELIANERWLFAWEMGCGKTGPVAVALRKILGNRLALISCPKSCLSVWRSELEKHAGLDCTILTGTPKQRNEIFDDLSGIIVTNYEMARVEAKRLGALDLDVLVADECHRLKDPRAKQSRALQSFQARRRWALSGTPAPNGPLDWHGVLMFLDPSGRLAGTAYKTTFRNTYAVTRPLPGRRGVNVVIGYRNLDQLRRTVASVSSRVTKEEALDLPPKIFSTRTCRLSATAAKVYGDLKRQAVARLASHCDKCQGTGRGAFGECIECGGTGKAHLSVSNVLTESLRLGQVTGGFVPSDTGKMEKITPNAKMDLLRDVLEDVEPPAIIWCAFVAEVKAVADGLSGAAAKPWRPDYARVGLYHGATPQNEREAILRDFQDGRLDWFVGTPQSGSVGITLTAAATAVYYSRDWSMVHWTQSQDRPHRIGQDRPVNIIKLMAEGTVDEKIDAALDEKIDLHELMLKRGVDGFF